MIEPMIAKLSKTNIPNKKRKIIKIKIKKKTDSTKPKKFKIKIIQKKNTSYNGKFKPPFPKKKFKCDDCDWSFSAQAFLNRHIASKHKSEWLYCNLCDKKNQYKTKLDYNMGTHQSNIHGSSAFKFFKCDVKGCKSNNGKPFETNYKQSLQQHMASIHDIGVVYNYCSYCKDEGKETKFKHKKHLTSHIKSIHGIGVKWLYCDICKDNGKEHKTKRLYHLNQHKMSVHDIGVTWHYCDICKKKGTEFKSKRPDGLIKHKIHTHGVGEKMLICNLCTTGVKFKCKDKANMKGHKEFVHDVGTNKCDFCLNNRNSQIPYDKHIICVKCYNTVTGKKLRIEHVISNYLDKEFGTEYLVLSDKSLTKIGGCNNFRPDKLYMSPQMALHIEVDEFQHKYENGTYKCDEKRMSIIAENCGSMKYVCIRINPHAYVAPHKSKRIKITERMEMLVNLMKHVVKNPPDNMQQIYYMFYNLYMIWALMT